ncbi:MAG: dihydrofolate reductase family protein [Chloroflexota bacterium]
MRKVVVSEFLSLDGVMEDPGGAEGFQHGGWTMAYWDDDIGKLKFEELFAADALLLGRVTYQGFAAAWPTQSDDAGFADRMNALPKYVASQTLNRLEWNNSHLIQGDLLDHVSRLKQQSGGDILIAGSGRLVQSLMPHDLIDEYRFLVYPIVLGSGKRLFAGGLTAKLRLTESKTFKSGVLSLTYQPAGR